MLKPVIKNISSSILSILIIFLLSLVVLLGAASVLINANTAAYVWFDVGIDSETWLSGPKYNWKNPTQIDEMFIRDKWVSVLSDVPIDYYAPEEILLNFAQAINSDINNEIATNSQFDNSIFDVMESETVTAYVNEFIRQQAGYLIGDNSLPLPDKTDINHILSASVRDKGSDLLQQWYNENKAYVTESFYSVLLSTNNLFDQTIVESDTSFVESVLILKVLNLNICIWIILGVAVVLFCITSFLRTKFFFFTFTAVSLFLSSVLSTAFLLKIGSISFFVVGNTFTPTKQMILHIQTALIWIPIVYVFISLVFSLLAIHKKWGIKNIFQSIRRSFLKKFKKN